MLEKLTRMFRCSVSIQRPDITQTMCGEVTARNDYLGMMTEVIPD